MFHEAFVFLGVSCCRRINFYLKVWWFLLNVVFLQTRQINQMIDEKVDLLVIAPNQLNSISPAINRAYDKGIPVIIYDRKATSNKYTAFIGCDNYAIGKSMGEFIAQKLKGKGRVVEIRGLEGSSPALERHRGFMEAMKQNPGVQVVVSEAGELIK